MSAKAIFFATVMIGSDGASLGTPETQAVTSFKHEFSIGFNPMDKCKTMERKFHAGNGPIMKAGLRMVSRKELGDGQRVQEIRTLCVEEDE